MSCADPFSDTQVGKQGGPLTELFCIFFLILGDRGDNDKENLNLENYRAQDPPASGEPPPQAPLSSLFSEDEPRPFGEGEDLSEAQGNLRGEGTGGQLCPRERNSRWRKIRPFLLTNTGCRCCNLGCISSIF